MRVSDQDVLRQVGALGRALATGAASGADAEVAGLAKSAVQTPGGEGRERERPATVGGVAYPVYSLGVRAVAPGTALPCCQCAVDVEDAEAGLLHGINAHAQQ